MHIHRRFTKAVGAAVAAGLLAFGLSTPAPGLALPAEGVPVKAGNAPAHTTITTTNPATGKIKHGVAGKRHRLISHNAKYIRQNRGTTVLSKADTATVKAWAPYGLN